jgi:hypothetical protein
VFFNFIMQTKILIFSLLLTWIAGFQGHAQPYELAGGLRLGSPAAFSFRYLSKENRAIEAFLGFRNQSFYSWTVIGGTYSYYSNLLDVKGLYWFGGGGASLFLWSWKSQYSGPQQSGTSLGVNGHLGLDYKFSDLPLNLSLDWMPVFFLNGYSSGISGGYGALCVRYVFR